MGPGPRCCGGPLGPLGPGPRPDMSIPPICDTSCCSCSISDLARPPGYDGNGPALPMGGPRFAEREH
jgi:hypothetical protein